MAASSQARTLSTQPYLELGGSSRGLTAATRAPKQGDVMAGFSSRGGPDLALGISKPDLSAPGVEILAGHTPAPARHSPGQGSELFQVLAGTSASAAHVAGAGALLKQLHPGWTPGQIQSALMMTARTEGLVKEDGLTPAGPFDRGAGRLDLARTAQVSLTMAPQAGDFVDHQDDLWNANYPSLYLPSMPGRITVQRTIHNHWHEDHKWLLSAWEPEGVSISVPNQLRVKPDSDETFEIVIEAEGVPLGEVRHTAIEFKLDDFTMYMPVTLVRQQPVVSLDTRCTPALMPPRVQSHCTITMTNISTADAAVSLRDPLPKRLGLVPGTLAGATAEAGASVADNTLRFEGTLAGTVPALRLVDEPALYGYVPLADFGVEAAACPDDCDDGGLLVGGLDFIYQDIHYDQAIWSVNGTLELGTSSGIAASGANTALPDAALPNNLLAPWWTDLDLSAGGEWYAGALSDGAHVYDVFEWRDVPRYGDTASTATFQIWLARGTNLGWFTYGGFQGDLADGTTGVEGAMGTQGQAHYHGEGEAGVAPRGDLYLDQNSGAPGETHLITFSAEGVEKGRWRNCVLMTGDLWEGEAAACTSGQVMKP